MFALKEKGQNSIFKMESSFSVLKLRGELTKHFFRKEMD